LNNRLFSIINDQCRLPDPSDKRLYEHLRKEIGKTSPLFSISTSQAYYMKFSVRHYAGVVEYSAEKIIVKNIDNVPKDTFTMLAASSNLILNEIIQKDASLFKGTSSSSSNSNNNNSNTRSSTNIHSPSYVDQVKSSMSLLIKEINPTKPHYVRCLIPYDKKHDEHLEKKAYSLITTMNSSSSATASTSAVSVSVSVTRQSLIGGILQQKSTAIRFNQQKVSEQLVYGGVIEALKTVKAGFRCKLTYAEFYGKYRMIINEQSIVKFEGPVNIPKHWTDDRIRSICIQFIFVASGGLIHKVSKEKHYVAQSIQYIDRSTSPLHQEKRIIDLSNMPLGNTLIFIKKKEFDFLEILRNQNLPKFAVLLQKSFLCMFYRIRYHRVKSSARLIGRVERGRRARSFVRKYRRYLLELSASKLLQRMERGRQARFVAKALRIARINRLAATLIQRRYRGYRARIFVIKYRAEMAYLKAVTNVQRVIRGFLGRCRAAHVFDARQQYNAAVLIGRVMRGFLARVYVAEIRHFRRAVICLQRRYRQLRWMRKVILIQTRIRIFRAQLLLIKLRDERERLKELYGPLLQARKLRFERRKLAPTVDQLDATRSIPMMSIESILVGNQSSEETLLYKLQTFFSQFQLRNAVCPESYVDFTTIFQALKSNANELSPSTFTVKLRFLLQRLSSAELLLNRQTLISHTWIGKWFGWKAFAMFSSGSNNAPETNIDRSTHAPPPSPPSTPPAPPSPSPTENEIAESEADTSSFPSDS
jgi:hypothetical protein